MGTGAAGSAGTAGTARTARLLAISDVHVAMPKNRQLVAELRPGHPGDWLIVAGDVAERAADVEWALTTLSRRFSKVVWVPGNHELWTLPNDPVELRGEARYRYLVQVCRKLGVLTPEDPYAVWTGSGGPVTLVPLFLLYDYSFLPPGAANPEEGLALAHEAGIVCTDEYLLYPDPHPSREAWCDARLAATEARLADLDPAVPIGLISHFPLTRHPVEVLRHPEFAQWCGTTRTAEWHVRYRAAFVVYGHLHIPGVTYVDGVPFTEVSLGYSAEWEKNPERALPRQILPAV
jgi:3',5'-cyclic AMP phosphodiesterase CpdA